MRLNRATISRGGAGDLPPAARSPPFTMTDNGNDQEPGHRPPPAPRGPEYPAGPPQQPAFGRRAPQRGPRPDADGFYPSDYYVGPDWLRIIAGTILAAVLLVGAIGGGLYLFDRYNPTDDETVELEPTPTPLPLVPVYQCAGDAQAVTEMMAPLPTLIAGRTADSRWLAFRNPQGTPLQLWVRATSVPDFDAFTVGIVSCATSSNEFPTPLSVPTPVPTASPAP